MQLFQIGPLNVSREKFKEELKKNGLPYGYIPKVYEKFKNDNLTVFRVLIENCLFTVITDDEKSYPEISEEIGKKVEPYSFEWLVDLEERARMCGPIFHDVLLRELQMYIRVRMAEKRELAQNQENCPYCHGQKGISPDGDEAYDKEADGIFLIGNEIRAQADCGWIVFKGKINFCPICSRKLEEKA